MLSQIDEELPFARHIGSIQQFHMVERFVAGMFVWTKEVIISNPESEIIVGTINVIKTIGFAIGSFVCTV